MYDLQLLVNSVKNNGNGNGHCNGNGHSGRSGRSGRSCRKLIINVKPNPYTESFWDGILEAVDILKSPPTIPPHVIRHGCEVHDDKRQQFASETFLRWHNLGKFQISSKKRIRQQEKQRRIFQFYQPQQQQKVG